MSPSVFFGDPNYFGSSWQIMSDYFLLIYKCTSAFIYNISGGSITDIHFDYSKPLMSTINSLKHKMIVIACVPIQFRGIKKIDDPCLYLFYFLVCNIDYNHFISRKCITWLFVSVFFYFPPSRIR